MTGWDAWVGPAIVAAVISGLVSFFLVQLNFRQERKIEHLRRAEKVRDFQIALRAEIASDLLNMEVADRAQLLAQVAAALSADPSYVPLLPRLASNSIFEVVVKEIHILPGNVISPVVHYERLRQSLERFIDDSRSTAHRDLSAERRLLIYSDYAATYDRLEGLARNALRVLEESLGINKTAADPLSPTPASAKDAASTENYPP